MASAVAKARLAVGRQIDSMREAEAAEDSWFALPEEGDDDVNWLDFQVEIQGPDVYDDASKTGADGAGRPSPYKGGVFRVQITIPDAYPMEAPRVTFKTRIWHPNVNRDNGKPCMEGLSEEWKATHTILDVLKYVRGLLAQPNAADHVNGEAAREMLDSLDAFDAHAREETTKYAAE